MKTRIYIVAKVPEAAARKLAQKHGLPELTKLGDTRNVVLFTVPNTVENWNKVSAWFVDPDTGLQAPFSPGACLWHTEIE